MRTTLILMVLSLLAAGVPPVHAEDFGFTVRHHHTFRDCRGALKISGAGIAYQSSHGDDARTWKWDEIRVIKAESPTEITLLSYEDQKRFLGKDRVFAFTLLEGKISGDLSAFLLSKVPRPMTLAVLPAYGKPAFELPVKHLHTFGGVSGTLRVYRDRVVFQASTERDSRVWRLADIQRFGQPDRYRFQITSFVPKAGGPTEVYNFQLLNELPEGVYDYLWVRLHPSSYYPPGQPNQ
jgi:hypothetical protein